MRMARLLFHAFQAGSGPDFHRSVTDHVRQERNNATKDATMSDQARNHERQGRNHERQGRDLAT